MRLPSLLGATALATLLALFGCQTTQAPFPPAGAALVGTLQFET